MAELEVLPCCSAEAQAECCDPADKAECCGQDQGDGCGCV